MGNHVTPAHHHHHYAGTDVALGCDNAYPLHLTDLDQHACYKDHHDLSLWQQYLALWRELWAELQPEAIAARIDAWAASLRR